MNTTENKKIKNASKQIYNDIKFDSKLEVNAYKILREAGIEFDYNLHRYEIIPGFTYNGERIRPMTFKPDFVGNGWIMETKGFSSDGFPIRFKVFKYWLYVTGEQVKIYLVHNIKEIHQAVLEIKEHERLLRSKENIE